MYQPVSHLRVSYSTAAQFLVLSCTFTATSFPFVISGAWKLLWERFARPICNHYLLPPDDCATGRTFRASLHGQLSAIFSPKSPNSHRTCHIRGGWGLWTLDLEPGPGLLKFEICKFLIRLVFWLLGSGFKKSYNCKLHCFTLISHNYPQSLC